LPIVPILLETIPFSKIFLFIAIKIALIFQIYFVKKFYVFRAVPLPIVRSFPLYIRHWYMSCRFDDSFQARPGWNSNGVPSIWEISASVAFLEEKFVTMLGHT
jgi:hypothetical protein